MNTHILAALPLAAVLGVLTTTGSAAAQVNIEAIRKAQDKQGFTGSVGGNVTSRTGNVDGLMAGGSGRVQFRDGRHLTFVYVTGNYARWNGKTSMSKAMAHWRYNYELLPWLIAEAFVQEQNNRFQKLTHRELIGSGPRFLLLKTDDLRFVYGTSAMLEWETLALSPDDPAPTRTLAVRWSHYLTWSWQVDERFALESTTYVQPRFDEFGDLRVLHEASLEAGITDRVSAKVSTRIRYDSEPPMDVRTTDIQLTNGFSVKF